MIAIEIGEVKSVGPVAMRLRRGEFQFCFLNAFVSLIDSSSALDQKPKVRTVLAMAFLDERKQSSALIGEQGPIFVD